MAKKSTWPKIKFHEKGPKVPVGGFDGLGFGLELDYYGFLHRWNGGVPSPDCFKVKSWDDEYTVAKVEYFHGIYHDNPDYRDLRHAVYHTWNYLPRGALPIAVIDIEEDDWDVCTLLTFTWTDRCNKIYLLANPHDCGPYDPDDLERLQPVANSLPQFLKLLKPFDELKYRVWFQLPTSVTELEPVTTLLNGSGFDDFGRFSDIDDLHSVAFYHDDLKFAVWLAIPNARIREVSAPKKVSKESCVLAIDAFQWNHASAERHIKTLLKPLKLDRKLRRLGETPIN